MQTIEACLKNKLCIVAMLLLAQANLLKRISRRSQSLQRGQGLEKEGLIQIPRLWVQANVNINVAQRYVSDLYLVFCNRRTTFIL